MKHLTGLLCVMILCFNPFVASGASPDVKPEDLEQLLRDRPEILLVDVRTAEEFATGHFHNALNIPVDELPGRLSELPQDGVILIYCAVGKRSKVAQMLLWQLRPDLEVLHLDGKPAFPADGNALLFLKSLYAAAPEPVCTP